MNVLYLMYNGLLCRGGEQSLNFHRLRALEWARARTWVASQENPADLDETRIADARAEVADFAPSSRIAFYRRRAARPDEMVRDLTRLCQAESINLVIFTQVQNLMAVRGVKKATGLPVIWDCRAGADARLLARGGPVQVVKNALFRWGYGPAAKLSDHIVVVSEEHAQHMTSRFGYPREKMTVVPNATDTDVFRPDAARGRKTRKELGLSEHQLVVIFCGSVQPWQCLPESVALFGRMREQRPDAHLLVLTPHVPEASSLLAASLPAGQYTVTTAAHSEVPRYLAAADIGLLLRRPTPRNAVASPTKFAEYIACGLPTVIGPGVGDYSELVASRQLGVVVDPDSPRSWPGAACSLLKLVSEDPRGTSQRCRETAIELLSVLRQRESFICAVETVAAGNPVMETADDA